MSVRHWVRLQSSLAKKLMAKNTFRICRSKSPAIATIASREQQYRADRIERRDGEGHTWWRAVEGRRQGGRNTSGTQYHSATRQTVIPTCLVFEASELAEAAFVDYPSGKQGALLSIGPTICHLQPPPPPPILTQYCLALA
ncbi:hypothetical protein K0M31_010027 [Melipona bicolor]|uniref:Uncharacterized protein n=1 Tax=Melipona bicolor TaxID=60889 RepID=A0AA40FMR1_9HYME|nr:hypothetical protein K0M31_010027 [Melipona bicolor]